MSQKPITPEQLLRFFNRPRRASPAPAEEAFLASGRRSSIVHLGGRVASWTWPGAPRVLLVHGWDSHAAHLGAIAGALLEAGFGVVAFDAPAHGQSEGHKSSVLDIGRAIGAVAAAAGPFDAVVAHSVGSPATLHAFAEGLSVRASVHIAGPASLDRVLNGQAKAAGLSREQHAEYRRLVEADIDGTIEQMELANLAHGFRHPALLLHAPEDAEIPFAESEALHRAWPGSRLVPLPGLGHRRIIGSAETIGAITAFLDAVLRRELTPAA